jgi:MazG family protein
MTPSINRLRQIVAQLRGPEGCPWDREQTHQTLKPHLLEECYEVLEAIDNADQAELKEELGDLLLQVVLHAQFAEEEERFDLDQVADAISEKLIRRHPHVFGENRLPDSAAVLRQWDAIKREEKQKRPSALDGVPAALPALARAQKIQTKAARVGFDWDSAAAVEPKLREEMDELAEATGEAKASELGDLLFTVVNYARKNNLEAEDLLRTATAKFERRFRKVEQFAAAKKKVLSKMTPQELDNLWEKAKAESRNTLR